jgi:hypothetical protein
MSSDRAELSGSRDRKVIACNYVSSTSACAAGSLCFVTQFWNGEEKSRVQILARSRSGRWIQKWEGIDKLSSYRIKTLPPAHPLYYDCRITSYDINALLECLQGFLRNS